MVKNTKSESNTVSRGTKRKVFIVDDHPIVRKGLTQLINQENDLQLCGEAADISNAIPLIKETKPEAAIIDTSLGPLSGFKLIENLCQQFPDLPVLVLSLYNEMLYAERCLRAGAMGYIMKQAPPHRILMALRKVLDGEFYISNKLGPKLLNKLLSKSTGVSTSSIEQLSNRELEVFQFIGQGMKTRDMAESLNLSVKTIETYIAHIKKKMGFKSSRELFLYAVQWSIMEKEF